MSPGPETLSVSSECSGGYMGSVQTDKRPFTSLKLLPHLLYRIKIEGILVIAPDWPRQIWFSDLITHELFETNRIICPNDWFTIVLPGYWLKLH